MKQDSFPVTQDAIRLVGEPDKCYLCDALLGEEHKQDCVFRERTIIIELKCNIMVSVPEDWDRAGIEFFYNQSSHCVSNLLDILQRLDCICPFSEVTFIREATQEDETDYCKEE